jgi:alpha-tubulin suppressor-like RCC1 family protein
MGTNPRSTPRRINALALVTLLASVGCSDDPTAPSDASVEPELATATTAWLVFRQLSVGGGHNCGVTTTNVAYCWGVNDQGQLGNGSTSTGYQRVPQPVAGGLRFKQVSAGFQHTCGLTTLNQLYCWGWNFQGELGDGTGYPVNVRRLTPARVRSLRQFSQVRAGNHHTCAIEAGTGAAFCWGVNTFGQLGDDTQDERRRPVRVKGGRQYRQISAGVDHTCGVTTDNIGYCWGQNFWGQFGNGTTIGAHHPVRAGGTLRYTMLQAGRYHTCGLTATQRTHCWGRNADGQLGDGTRVDHIRPAAVAGGLRFDQISSSGEHVCGRTPEDLAYCWGINGSGQIGDGTTDNDRLVPTAVTGGLRFTGVWAGLSPRSCGLASDQRTYCWGSAYLAVPTPIPGAS